LPVFTIILKPAWVGLAKPKKTAKNLINGCNEMANVSKNLFNQLTDSGRWHLLVDAAKRGAEDAGYALSRMPGRGLSNIWNIEKNGKTLKASIRTTRDRWVAFPPLEGGTRWKTLDEVDVVIVATLDSKDDPRRVEVYIFPANEVRERFNEAYAARTKAGHQQKDNFGMWVALDPDARGIAASVGSGLAGKYKPVATYLIETLIAAATSSGAPAEDKSLADEEIEQETRPATIAEVLDWARERVAEIAGVRVDAVKLDLKVQY
jgi:hypothetical protein